MYKTKVYRKRNWKNIKWRKVLFYSCLMAIPVIQISLFYVYVNFNSFLMAFRSYVLDDEGYLVYNYSWDNLKNFKTAWEVLVNNPTMVRNTFVYFIFGLLVNLPLALLSSYYLYKKKHASGFFKVMLFMPQVLSSIVLAILYKEILESVYPSLTGNAGLLMSNNKTIIPAVIIFNLIMSFGVNVLIYTSAMSGVNNSLMESAQLDGCNAGQQFLHIILPMIYPTITSLLVVSISCFFTNQYNIFTLFSTRDGSVATTNIGYFLYVQNLNATERPALTGFLSYPELSALGLILTGIILPISLLSRWALNKFGPRAD